jgi:hypothetical protein
MNNEAKMAIADEISSFVLILKHFCFVKTLSLSSGNTLFSVDFDITKWFRGFRQPALLYNKALLTI